MSTKKALPKLTTSTLKTLTFDDDLIHIDLVEETNQVTWKIGDYEDTHGELEMSKEDAINYCEEMLSFLKG